MSTSTQRISEHCSAVIISSRFGSNAAHLWVMIPNQWVRSCVQGANVTLPNFYNTFDNLNTKRDAILLRSKLTLDTALKDPIWSQVGIEQSNYKGFGSRSSHALTAAVQLQPPACYCPRVAPVLQTGRRRSTVVRSRNFQSERDCRQMSQPQKGVISAEASVLCR